MMQTMNSYTLTAKTAEIMARYRPIAPKPEVTANAADVSENTSMPQNIRQSAYLRTVWPDLQSRPQEPEREGGLQLHHLLSRDKGLVFKDSILFLLLRSWPKRVSSAYTCPNLKYHRPQRRRCSGKFMHVASELSHTTSPPNSFILTIDTQQAPPPETIGVRVCGGNKDIDLNTEAEDPEEQDFLQQLQGPTSPISLPHSRFDRDDSGRTTSVQLLKKPEEVEEEVESEALPAIVSDSNNKVRLANSAYKEMVGQPECSWLDTAGGRRRCMQEDWWGGDAQVFG
ncbi:unnamed protein product [Ilex paraguariensis]|uniref:PAS domain-containing protein n=1 Tax=Ilex paraguariensis TaxID=185542 RepID=A0ABC8TFI9_9AQUA